MKINRLILAFAAAAVVFALPACSKSEDSKSDSDAKESKLSSDVITEEFCFVPSDADEKKEAAEFEKQKELSEKWEARAENVLDYFNRKVTKAMMPYRDLDPANLSAEEQQKISQEIQQAQTNLVNTYGSAIVEKAGKIEEGFKKECPLMQPGEKLSQLLQISNSLKTMLQSSTQGESNAPEAQK